MNERIPELLIALTLFLIGLQFVIVKILSFFNAGVDVLNTIPIALTWIMFISATITAIVLVRDARRK